MPDPTRLPSRPSLEVEAYLEAAPEASRARLREIVDLIRAELPDATERIAYAMPTWYLVENVVHVAGYERHVGLYPGSAAMAAFAEDFAGLATSKGTVQFPHDRALPLDLVRRVVRWRLERVREKGAARPPTRARARPAAVAPVPEWIDPGPLAFDAILHRSDSSGAACFVDFPWGLKATYGKGNLVPVVSTWDGHVEYRGVLSMMGGDRALLICRKDVLARLGKGPGDPVRVSVSLDLAPREVEAPAALAAALDAADGARAAWDGLSPSCRREYVQWIDEAKRDATRDARVAKAVPMILDRRRLKG